MIDPSRHHEQQIRQAIDIANEQRVNRRLQRDHPALRSSADRPGEVQPSRRLYSTGENDRGPGGQVAFKAIDQLLETLDIRIGDDRLGDARRDRVRGIGEPGAEGEQIALNPNQRISHLGVYIAGATRRCQRRQHPPEAGIQFVDFAVGVDAHVAFRHASAAEEGRVASVTGARVNFHDVDDGIFII